MLFELLHKSRQLCGAGQVNLNRCGANAKSNQVFYSLRRSVFLFALGDDNVSAFAGQAERCRAANVAVAVCDEDDFALKELRS